MLKNLRSILESQDADRDFLVKKTQDKIDALTLKLEEAAADLADIERSVKQTELLSEQRQVVFLQESLRETSLVRADFDTIKNHIARLRAHLKRK